MEAAKRVLAVVCILGLAFGMFIVGGKRVSAQDLARHTTVIMPYTEYEWWLIRWQDNQILCQVLIDHEGPPTIGEVVDSCGVSLADQWWATPSCDPKKLTTQCQGLYVFFFASTPKEREVIVELPPPVIWLSLEGCIPAPPDNLCTALPTLVLTGEEPLPDEHIVAIQGTYDGEPFSCPGDICKLPMRPTPIQGVTVEFWADSSYGDSSEHFTAQVRVIDSGTSPVPGGEGWYVDLISTQWQGASLASCARIWEAFPPVGTPPQWLSTPDHFELLSSGDPYYYLAGRLISQGLVDGSICPNTGGLLPNGYADACGLEVARPLVEQWQNQFDNRIIEVAQETGVPAQLMKNLFAQESQFWPGMYRVPFEFGLGQITDKGTDSIFLWNPGFFQEFCPLVLSESACAQGYLGLTVDNQAILRGALALQSKADCTDCPTGIDLSNVYFNIRLFASTLQANCAQIARTVYTATDMMAGRAATYEDLWRLTIANYHAGPGCTAFAIHQAWGMDKSLAWDKVATRFTEPCNGVVPYVDEITR